MIQTATHARRGERQDSIADHFLDCLDGSQAVHTPFDYWLIDTVLPESTVDAIAQLPFAPPAQSTFSGTREANNSTRVYFTPENCRRFPVCHDVVAAFSDPRVSGAIARRTGADLTAGALRIEYCLDVDGFWLEPHLDISVKLFTMLVYLSDDPNLRDAGTDIYDATPAHNPVARAPHEKNTGLIFIPGHNTWHGFSPRPIRGIRKSIIVNWVGPEWRDKWELAYATP